VGLQTANSDSLSEIGRKALSVRRFDRILDAVLPHYPNLRVDLLFGLPNIGLRELKDSVRFLLDRRIWLFNLFRLVAIPGTELAENKAKYGVVAEEDYPFTVYASDGCSSEDMFEMEQFKANIAAVRYLLADDGYQAALRAGIDLVDFADALHRHVPDLNRMVPYASDTDFVPGPELVAALLVAAAAYAPTDEARKALESLIRSRFATFECGATPGASGGDATRHFITGRAERAEPAPAAVTPGRARVELRVQDGGPPWTLVVEEAVPGSSYFTMIDHNGLYYEQIAERGDDRSRGALLRALLRRLPPRAAGAPPERPQELAARLARVQISGLRLELASPSPENPAVSVPQERGAQRARLPILVR
jgi:hypothetical protein